GCARRAGRGGIVLGSVADRRCGRSGEGGERGADRDPPGDGAGRQSVRDDDRRRGGGTERGRGRGADGRAKGHAGESRGDPVASAGTADGDDLSNGSQARKYSASERFRVDFRVREYTRER